MTFGLQHGRDRHDASAASSRRTARADSAARRSGAARPWPAASRPGHRARFFERPVVSWARIASIIWSSMRITGLSEFIAPCGTKAMSRRRILRSALSSRVRRSLSPRNTRPPTMRPGGRVIRMSAVAIVVLPEPDSPMSPRRWPARSSNETSIHGRDVAGVRPVDDLEVLDPEDDRRLGAASRRGRRRSRVDVARFGRHQSRRSRGFAKRSMPADVTNRARKMNAIIAIGGPHHHQKPRSTAVYCCDQ